MRDPTRLSAMAGPIGLELVLAEPGTFVTVRSFFCIFFFVICIERILSFFLVYA